jgi:predicted nucleic acid-binding protein
MSVVIDASVAVAWCFEDEASPAMDAIADQIREDGGMVPALWLLEVANVLLQAEKRGRITMADVTLRLDLIKALPVQIDPETTERVWRDTIALARNYGLTVYDAVYLELAIRLGIPLATKDKALGVACQRAGVGVLG